MKKPMPDFPRLMRFEMRPEMKAVLAGFFSHRLDIAAAFNFVEEQGRSGYIQLWFHMMIITFLGFDGKLIITD
jgi:hypothetical protein